MSFTNQHANTHTNLQYAAQLLLTTAIQYNSNFLPNDSAKQTTMEFPSHLLKIVDIFDQLVGFILLDIYVINFIYEFLCSQSMSLMLVMNHNVY